MVPGVQVSALWYRGRVQWEKSTLSFCMDFLEQLAFLNYPFPNSDCVDSYSVIIIMIVSPFSQDIFVYFPRENRIELSEH